MKPAAIILAAGNSSRMGRPKALLPFRAGTFLSVLAGTLRPWCSPVIAVFGAGADTLMAHVPAEVAPVINHDYRLGMLTSLQTGLRALPAESRGAALFTPVDHPAVSPETIRALISSQASIVIPRFQGKRGHPVLVRSGIVEEILREPVTSKIHDVIDRNSGLIEYVDIQDPAIHDDIDDPELYSRLIARETEPV